MTGTNQVRSEFEAWHASKHGWLLRHYDYYWNESYYANDDFQGEWEAWQASRQAVVVRLPKSATKKGREYVAAVGRFIVGQGLNVEAES